MNTIITCYLAKPVPLGDMPVTDGPYPASDTVMVTTGVAWRFERQP